MSNKIELYYCYGSENNGNGVRRALKEKYTTRTAFLDEMRFNDPQRLYFVNGKGYFASTPRYSEMAEMLLKYGEEIQPITLPPLTVIRGDEERGAEVIKALEDMGGKNDLHYGGTQITAYYFIGVNGYIHYLDTKDPYFNDYTLNIWKMKPKLKVVQGSPTRGEEVIKTLTDMGGENLYEMGGDAEGYYYFIKNGYICQYDMGCSYFDNFDLEVIELKPKEEKEPQKVTLYRAIVTDAPNKGTFSTTELFNTKTEAMAQPNAIGYIPVECYVNE